MAISVSYTGNGYAYVDNPNPLDGETVTLYCEPDEGETLDDVTATDINGYAIALATTEEQTFTYQESWVEMYIDVVFSGTPTPPPPTPTTRRRKHMPIWMYPSLRA